MFLREIYESDNKIATVAFGRMNPPTTGHLKLVKTLESLPGDSFLFLSHKQQKNSDPLDFQTKLKFAECFFPNITVGNEKVRTIIQAMQHLDEQQYQSVIFVAGQDRIDEFASLLHKYNGDLYNFKNISTVSSGDRSPNATDVAGMSATKLRRAALNNDYTTFLEGVPNPSTAKELYDAVRSGMGLLENKTLSLPRKSAGAAQLRTPENPDAIKQDIPTVTPILLRTLEKYLDKLFARLGIDIEFTRHFLDRVNDQRNIKQITIQELLKLFRETYSKYGKRIVQMGPDAQAVIKDMQTDINLPFVLSWDDRNQELDLIAKTVIRKKNFRTTDLELRI